MKDFKSPYPKLTEIKLTDKYLELIEKIISIIPQEELDKDGLFAGFFPKKEDLFKIPISDLNEFIFELHQLSTCKYLHMVAEHTFGYQTFLGTLIIFEEDDVLVIPPYIKKVYEMNKK